MHDSMRYRIGLSYPAVCTRVDSLRTSCKCVKIICLISFSLVQSRVMSALIQPCHGSVGMPSTRSLHKTAHIGLNRPILDTSRDGSSPPTPIGRATFSLGSQQCEDTLKSNKHHALLPRRLDGAYVMTNDLESGPATYLLVEVLGPGCQRVPYHCIRLVSFTLFPQSFGDSLDETDLSCPGVIRRWLPATQTWCVD